VCMGIILTGSALLISFSVVSLFLKRKKNLLEVELEREKICFTLPLLPS